MPAASEASAILKIHKVWMVELLKENSGSCSYEAMVAKGEEKHCDTVGAMLKILKSEVY